MTSLSSTGHLPRSYLNSSISGEDRRAPTNTIDESVWETLSRDFLAVWEKMRLVLWPRHLLGGLLQRDTGIEDAERGESRGFTHILRAGRWPDSDTVLQQRMSEGLRDWDLWHVPSTGNPMLSLTALQGPSHLLPPFEFITFFDGFERAENHGFLGRLCSGMGW